jgi:predicted ABC-class ATPase
VADGSILPRAREGGGPLAGAVPFVSTPEDQVEIAGVRGMLFRRGVTVITGGGYSGKSTLLDALSAGIYNHVEGDGRELVLTDQSAMKISAEDGRSVRHVNLSPFIKWMPGGDPADFSTDHASGSTSQAANVMEAVGWGVKLLLIDEDKSATNFMIQDPVMRILVEKEPVTPFVDRVRELQERKGVSTILVIGGSSEYLHVADKIYLMRDYVIREVTEAAGKLQASFWGQGEPAAEGSKAPLTAADFSNGDLVDANGLNTRPRGSSTEVLEVSDFGFLILGREQVDIRMLHNIVSVSQLNAAAFLLRRMFEKVNGLDRFQKYALGNRSGGMDGADGSRRESTLEEGESAGAKPRWICRREQVELLMEEIQEKGLEFVYSTFFSQCGRWLDLPRKYEVLAVLSRMRMDP